MGIENIPLNSRAISYSTSSGNGATRVAEPEFTETSSVWGCDVDALIKFLGYEKVKWIGTFSLCVAYQAIQMGLKEGEFDPQKFEEYYEEQRRALSLPATKKMREIMGIHKFLHDVAFSTPDQQANVDDFGRLVAAKYSRPVVIFDAAQKNVSGIQPDEIQYFSTFGDLQKFIKENAPILIYDSGEDFQALELIVNNKK